MIGGALELVPGLRVTNWLDVPQLRLRLGEDFRARKTHWVRQIILHTTKGIPGGNDKRPQRIIDGLGPFMDAGLACSRWWTKSPEAAGAHLVVDFDGQVSCCADLLTEAAYHARQANDTSIGIELYQGRDAELYDGQLRVAVQLVDWLTRRFGIQRQIPHQYIGCVDRLKSADELQHVVGVLGHRDLATNRGMGDPGNRIFNLLGQAGYEPLDFDQREDLDVWRKRQSKLRLATIDGVPGPATLAALASMGRPHGMWLSRPGDDHLQPRVG